MLGSPSCSRKLSDRFRRMRLRASAPTPGEIHLRKQWQKNSALCNRMTLSSQRSTSKNKYVTMPRENIALLPKYSQVHWLNSYSKKIDKIYFDINIINYFSVQESKSYRVDQIHQQQREELGF